MLFTDVIRSKRDGDALTRKQIDFLVAGLADGSIPGEQIAALAMAVYLNSMSPEEAGWLTLGMAKSGVVIDWKEDDLGGPVVDKHSTGGVGDKVSFLLAPIVAACGCFVPMISGRGLGHTGGTTDKAESIPGYDATPDFARFRRVVAEVGCAIIGQTADLAPADRRFYAIRDITATVESVPLITASILAKKIAAGLDALVMDVKVGSGAFMTTAERAVELAHSIIETAKRAELPVTALITDMNEVLGLSAGNGLEIEEAVRYLRGDEREPRLDAIVRALGAEMLLLTRCESDEEAAARRISEAIDSGAAAERFAKMVAGLGGPADFLERAESKLPRAAVQKPVDAGAEGYLAAVDTFAVGNAIIELGGGRRRLDDKLDHAVGFSRIVPIGSRIDGERPLAVVHAATDEDAEHAAGLYRDACTLAAEAPAERAVIQRTLRAE